MIAVCAERACSRAVRKMYSTRFMRRDEPQLAAAAITCFRLITPARGRAQSSRRLPFLFFALSYTFTACRRPHLKKPRRCASLLAALHLSIETGAALMTANYSVAND